MATYILLMQYTDEGIRNASYMPEHIRAFRQAVEAAGGTLPGIYMTLGPYDFVAILEAPTDERCATIALVLASVGNFRTTSLKAFEEEALPEITERVSSLEDQFARLIGGFGGIPEGNT